MSVATGRAKRTKTAVLETPSPAAASPGPSPGPDTVALQRSKASVEITWTRKRALCQDSHGHWHVALQVRACKQLTPPFKVSFTRDSTTDERSCESSLQVLEDTSKRTGVFPKIIYDFLGGQFTDADGMSAKPASVANDSVVYDLFHGGVSIGEPITTTVEDFISTFSPPIDLGVAEMMDFGPCLHLKRAMTAAGLLTEGGETALPLPEACEVLASVIGQEVVGLPAAQAAAKRAERMAAASDASPAKKKLRLAVQRGALVGASMATRASVMTRLALGSDVSPQQGKAAAPAAAAPLAPDQAAASAAGSGARKRAPAAAAGGASRASSGQRAAPAAAAPKAAGKAARSASAEGAEDGLSDGSDTGSSDDSSSEADEEADPPGAAREPAEPAGPAASALRFRIPKRKAVAVDDDALDISLSGVTPPGMEVVEAAAIIFDEAELCAAARRAFSRGLRARPRASAGPALRSSVWAADHTDWLRLHHGTPAVARRARGAC